MIFALLIFITVGVWVWSMVHAHKLFEKIKLVNPALAEELDDPNAASEFLFKPGPGPFFWYFFGRAYWIGRDLPEKLERDAQVMTYLYRFLAVSPVVVFLVGVALEALIEWLL